MDKEGVFWYSLWRAVFSFVFCIAVVIAVWNHYNNERYAKMWLECVNAGGQPISEPMLGSDSKTFTCVRP